jgi:hypothetical protein
MRFSFSEPICRECLATESPTVVRGVGSNLNRRRVRVLIAAKMESTDWYVFGTSFLETGSNREPDET